MLIKRVSFNDFIKEFENHGRENQFSYEAKKALYEYLNQISEDLGEPIELDVISLCCDYTEFSNLEEFSKAYGLDDINDMEDIEDYTTVIQIDDESFIIEDF